MAKNDPLELPYLRSARLHTLDQCKVLDEIRDMIRKDDFTGSSVTGPYDGKTYNCYTFVINRAGWASRISDMSPFEFNDWKEELTDLVADYGHTKVNVSISSQRPCEVIITLMSLAPCSNVQHSRMIASALRNG